MKDGLVRAEDMQDSLQRSMMEARRLISMIRGIIKLSRLDEIESGIRLERCRSLNWHSVSE